MGDWVYYRGAVYGCDEVGASATLTLLTPLTLPHRAHRGPPLPCSTMQSYGGHTGRTYMGSMCSIHAGQIEYIDNPLNLGGKYCWQSHWLGASVCWSGLDRMGPVETLGPDNPNQTTCCSCMRRWCEATMGHLQCFEIRPGHTLR